MDRGCRVCQVRGQVAGGLPSLCSILTASAKCPGCLCPDGLGHGWRTVAGVVCLSVLHSPTRISCAPGHGSGDGRRNYGSTVTGSVFRNVCRHDPPTGLQVTMPAGTTSLITGAFQAVPHHGRTWTVIALQHSDRFSGPAGKSERRPCNARKCTRSKRLPLKWAYSL
jgi:hypothetical protein